MLATEIAIQNPGCYSILLSSAKTKFEIPDWYRAAKYLPLQHLAPASLQRWFGVQNETETWQKTISKKVFTELIKRNDKEFNAWAVDALFGWRNETVPANVFYIHGT